jgi:glycerol-3-phosphate dehydrogenase (NAD(P)+)
MKMVAEGYFASKTIYDLKRDLDVKTPIIDAVYAILYQQESPEKSFKNLVQELT